MTTDEMLLTELQRLAILKLTKKLIDQENCRTIVKPYAKESGFWFGGGNMVSDEAGTIWLCGRYRNFGDSRTGLAAGTRGLECAIFRSDDGGRSFEKVASYSKEDLSREGRKVLSIEGTSLLRTGNGDWELFVSTEKEIAYPPGFESFQKPGTGVWTIDILRGMSPDKLENSTLQTSLENIDQPEYLHVKDPVAFAMSNDATTMIYCSHPFSWSSSVSSVAIREGDSDDFSIIDPDIVPRGPVWDVAATRITARLAIPKAGLFADAAEASVYFYDGAESLRKMEESPNAQSRPRGYSCEELGGAFFGWDATFPKMDERLSIYAPLFVSPYGTGCSRYVDVLSYNGGLIASWQQAQEDGSQSLVSHQLSLKDVAAILSGN